MSTIGWLKKSNHDPEDASIHNEAATCHAQNTMQHNVCNYSQHLPGRVNVVAGYLSWAALLAQKEKIKLELYS